MQNSTPLVSVIIPSYNHSKYIVECLNSVRDSDYKNLELIIIDDGSTDNSNEVIGDWLKENENNFVRTLHLQQVNAGVSKTANRLIGLSEGDIIVPLASDDALLPAGISLRVAFLLQNPQLLAVFGDAAMIDESSKIICHEIEQNIYQANKIALADPRFIASELILRWSVPGPVFAAWRKTYSAIEGVGLYDEFLQAEDRDYYLRLLSQKALGYIPDEVALYRDVQKSLCHDVENNISVRRGILKAEKAACDCFFGKEKFFIKLIYMKTKLDIKFSLNNRKFTLFLSSKIMEWCAKLAYRIHTVLLKISLFLFANTLSNKNVTIQHNLFYVF